MIKPYSTSISDLMMNLTTRNQTKLGLTTTVKDQVDQIQVAIDHFKKSLDFQRKQQSELQFQLKKLQQCTKTQFHQLSKQLNEKITYLSDLFKSDTRNQNKQFEYLQLQNHTLHDEHDKLNEIAVGVQNRTQEVQTNVGM